LRSLKHLELSGDLVVVGGGLSGVCCAVTAARQGIKVLLVQDRPVLGGNASSEVRLWVLGATSHMGNNNRWAREGGVIDELLVENMWRNPEGNAILFDSIMLETVRSEKNITLLLNTAVHELEMEGDAIARLRAFNSQNQANYTLQAPLFVDASGDGILGFLAGAEFRMGAEARSEFGEGMAPEKEEHSLLGHSLYFYSRDTGKPVKYVPPAFALKDITRIPRYRDIHVSDSGCRLWWLEYGGALDTVGETEEIKWELWSVAYGIWNHIKNSGEFAGAENLTLEWMGTIPGKRESRRFIGDVILTQSDLVEQKTFEDAVSFGGWAIDLHPSDGVFSPKPGCTQYHSKGVYQIPFRSMFSRNVPNLLLTGRLISATHIAFGSTRVMATCGSNGQAVGMAATLCSERGLLPRDLLESSQMNDLQQRLLLAGQHIPGVVFHAEDDLSREATLTASSSLKLKELTSNGELTEDRSYALLIPFVSGPIPKMSLCAQVDTAHEVCAELWTSERAGNTTPDRLLASINVPVAAGDRVTLPLYFAVSLEKSAHCFVMIPQQAGLRLYLSDAQLPGILTVSQKMNAAVAKSLVQTPPEGSGIDTFAFWLPERRPAARNLAVQFAEPLSLYEPAQIINGFNRPWCGVNAWVPAAEDAAPAVELHWEDMKTMERVSITFDTDFDHPMESVLMSHPERIMPGCITSFRVSTAEGMTLATVADHHQTRWEMQLPEPVRTKGLRVEVLAWGDAPPAIYNISCL
jgi:hypothetical protein